MARQGGSGSTTQPSDRRLEPEGKVDLLPSDLPGQDQDDRHQAQRLGPEQPSARWRRGIGDVACGRFHCRTR